MKKYIKTFLLGFLTLLAISSCSPKMSTFSKSLYEENKWTDQQLSRIQFFLSEDIVLWRSLRKGEVEITSGKVKLVNGEKVEEIVFERGTPGIFIKRKKDNHFAVSFEDGPDTRYLVFGPNNSPQGDYSLLAIHWKGRQGLIKYDGLKWHTTNKGNIAKLLIDIKEINERSTQQRKAGGRRIRD